ncbi:hypothetical protein ACFL5H_00455 [Candidatus Latescibacterota bacterium]
MSILVPSSPASEDTPNIIITEEETKSPKRCDRSLVKFVEQVRGISTLDEQVMAQQNPEQGVPSYVPEIRSDGPEIRL